MASLAFVPAPDALSFGPALSVAARTVLRQTKSVHTRRSYAKGIDALDDFADGRQLTRLLLIDWRLEMHRKNLSPGTINVRFTGVRQLVKEARRQKMISADEAAQLLDVQGLPNHGIKTGTWLTTPQCRELLDVYSRTTPRDLRNYCVIAVLLGTGLREDELRRLTVEHLDMEGDRWIIRNLRGKGGRTRSVALPPFAFDAIATWMAGSGIREGRLLRRLTLDPEGLSNDTIMEIVRSAAKKIGVLDFTPHDLRRTCAKLCRRSGQEIEQIQFMLGHASSMTTDRYLGGKQDLVNAPNDSLRF